MFQARYNKRSAIQLHHARWYELQHRCSLDVGITKMSPSLRHAYPYQIKSSVASYIVPACPVLWWAQIETGTSGMNAAHCDEAFMQVLHCLSEHHWPDHCLKERGRERLSDIIRYITYLYCDFTVISLCIIYFIMNYRGIFYKKVNFVSWCQTLFHFAYLCTLLFTLKHSFYLYH